MKKTKLFKSLLVAAGLCVGASAWAQETTTLLEYGTTAAPWTETNIADWTGKTLTLVDNSYVQYTGTDNGDFANTKTISPTTGTIINVTAVWRGRSNTGRYWSNNCGIYFRFGNIVVAQNDQDQKHGYTFSGLDNLSGVTTFTAGSYRTDIANLPWLLIEAEINTATNTLTSFTVKSEDGTTTYVSQTNIALTSPDYTTVSFGFQRGGQHNENKQEQLKSVKITETTQSVSYADYTVHFVDGDGAKVKADESRNGEVGTTVRANTADQETFYNGDNKYVYNNDGDGVEVKADGTAELTITYDKYGKYVATASAVCDGTTIVEELASASAYAGETATIQLQKYIKVGDVWYMTSANTYVDVTEEGNTEVTYAPTTVSYFYEFESLGGTRVDETSKSYSGGVRSRVGKSSSLYTPEEIEGGLYKVYIPWANSNSSAGSLVIYTRKDGENTETGFTLTATQGSGSSTYLINIPDGGALLFNNTNTTYNDNSRIDYITLTKIASMSIVGDFSANGWDATKGIAMTQSTDDPTVWTAVVKDYNVYSSKMSFEYKAVANGNWNDYELGNPNATNTDKNQEYNFNYDGAGQGRYTLTFTANLTENTVELAIEKQKTGEVFFVNTSEWDAPYIWVWDANNSNYNYTGGTWPGVAMTKTEEQQDGHDVYTWSTYDITGAPTNIIISNNGSETERTGDQAFVNGATYSADGTSTVTKTITAAGYATYCSASALDFSSATGLTAYIANKNGTEVSFTEVTKVPANTGLLLKGEAGEYTISTTTEEIAAVTDNALVGVTVDTPVAAGAFVLMNTTENGVGFYKTTKEFTVGANTAYIPALTGGATRSFIGINFEENTTTAIEGVATVKMESDAVYNLQGQRVSAAKKGLYIINGKKMVK